MLIAKVKRAILAVGILILSIPVHEYGHYIVAEIDGAQVHRINYFFMFNGTHFINPSITVNEFTFSSPEILILCYFGGFLITFVPGLLAATVLYLMESSIWKYPYLWVVCTPLVSLTDFDRVLGLLGLSVYAKWVHVGLGAGTVLMLGFMRGNLIRRN